MFEDLKDAFTEEELKIIENDSNAETSPERDQGHGIATQLLEKYVEVIDDASIDGINHQTFSLGVLESSTLLFAKAIRSIIEDHKIDLPIAELLINNSIVILKCELHKEFSKFYEGSKDAS